MKMGAEPKKVGFLVVLVGAAAYLLYVNTFPSQSGSAPEPKPVRLSSSNAPAQAVAPPAATPKQSAPAASRAAGLRGSAQEFRPPYHRKVADDLSKIDPKLRLDLLAKVQSVEAAPAERNIFQWGAAAAPTPAGVHESKPIHPKTREEIAREQAKLNAPPPPTGPPPPPPILLKYYGYVAQRSDGHKRAFFLDGEDILVAGEGETVKRRYKVVRIGVNSVTVEDTQFNNTQTLQLAEEAAG